MNSLPTDLVSIIDNYKKTFEDFDNQFDLIDELFDLSDDTECISLYISYTDIKEYLIKRNITYLKIQMNIYGENHPNNFKFWDLNLFEDDDTILEQFIVTEIAYSPYTNLLFLKLNEEKTENLETNQIENNFNDDFEMDEEEDEELRNLWLELE